MSLPRSSTGILLYATAAVVSILVRQVRIRMYLPPSSLPAVTTAVQVVETLLILEKPVGYFSIAHHRMYEYLYVYKVCFFQKKKSISVKSCLRALSSIRAGAQGVHKHFPGNILRSFLSFLSLCSKPAMVAESLLLLPNLKLIFTRHSPTPTPAHIYPPGPAAAHTAARHHTTQHPRGLHTGQEQDSKHNIA